VVKLSYQHHTARMAARRVWLRMGVGLILVAIAGLQLGASYTSLAAAAERALSARQAELSAGHDIQSHLKVAVESMNAARDTGDDSCYDKAEAALNKVFEIDPKNYEALRLKGWVQSGKHQFEEALASGEYASKLRPYDSWNYGVIVDALVELGRYKEAVDTAQEMVDLKPGMAAYTRIAYLRWLHGDPEGAVEMLEMAVDAGPPGAPETVWCVVQLGNEHFNRGRLDAAEVQYKRALEMLPGYTHALAGMGKVAAARKEYAKAIKFYKQAVAKNPSHGYVVALGDAHALAGDDKRANEQYTLVKRLAKERRSNPETGLKMALFYADHDEHLPEALALAKKDAGSSEDIQAWDVLAWAHYKNGRYDDAAAAMKKALRLGTEDALLFFHAGMIYRGLGDTEQAKRYLERAIETNPHFDPRYSQLAQDTLKELEKDRARADTVYKALATGLPAGALLILAAAAWLWRSKINSRP